jgi:hypothetical protein
MWALCSGFSMKIAILFDRWLLFRVIVNTGLAEHIQNLSRAKQNIETVRKTASHHFTRTPSP